MAETTQTRYPISDQLAVTGKLVPVLIALLLLGSVVFFKERMLFIDGPHVLFRIINDGHFWIEENRYGSFISQLLPFIGIKLHLPLYWVLVLYSAGFYLFYLAVIALIVYRYRNYGLAILFGFYFTLFVSEAFYWSNNEVHQGIGWLMLAFAANFHIAKLKRPLPAAIFFFLVTFFIAIWTHPLVMFVAVYLWVFYYLRNTDWHFNRRQSIIFSLFLLLLCYFKYRQSMSGGYDGSKIEVVRQFQPARIKAIFSSPMLRYFVKGCLTNYWLFVVVFVAGLVALLRERKYLILCWTVAFVAGYLAIICITFWDLNTNRFYIECEYMPMAIIGAAPFVYYVLPRFTWRVSTVAVALIFLVRLGYIYSAAPRFTNRLIIMNHVSDKMKEKKLAKAIITDLPANIDSALFMSWAAPVESFMASGINGEMPQTTFLFATPEILSMHGLGGRDTMLGCWEKRPVTKLNPVYFQLDTNSTYTVIGYRSLME